jgi:poly-gamma-glutamate capsule biosynthesis protein CapA/YwtB (metallophosphatase superfamily)
MLPRSRLTSLALALAVTAGVAQRAPAQNPPPTAGAARRFTIALTGDAIITRRLSPYREPEFLRMIELLRGADVAITNLEVLLHDYEPAPASESGGTWMRAEPAMAKELVWAGIDMANLANNHTGDYGVEGARLTRQHVAAAGIVGAGSGENLPLARAGHVLKTPKARVGLVGVAATGSVQSQAGAPRLGVVGRPGMSMLRIFTPPRTVERAQLESLRTTLRAIGQPVSAAGAPLRFFGTELVPGDRTATGGTAVPHPGDMREIGESVRKVGAVSDYVVVSVHAHTQTAYLQTFARGMIDAGADVFVAHGPHYLTGIEIYKGKPIFYSLGDFIFQNETLLRLPYENYTPYNFGDDMGAWVADFNNARYRNETTGFPVDPRIWESVIAVPTFERDRLIGIDLHPITLGYGLPAHIRGRPMLADRTMGKAIIDDLIRQSTTYGTRIEWDDARGIGVVRVP